jgi:hypothetical protein
MRLTVSMRKTHLLALVFCVFDAGEDIATAVGGRPSAWGVVPVIPENPVTPTVTLRDPNLTICRNMPQSGNVSQLLEKKGKPSILL